MSMQLPYSLRNLHAEIVRSLHGSHGKMTVQYPCDFTDTARTASGNLAIAVRGPCECTIALRFFFLPACPSKIVRWLHDYPWQRTMPVRGLRDAIYDMYTGYGLTIFKNLSNSSRNQIVEAAEPVNPHDNLTVSAQRLRGGCAERGLRAVYGLRRHIASQM